MPRQYLIRHRCTLRAVLLEAIGSTEAAALLLAGLTALRLTRVTSSVPPCGSGGLFEDRVQSGLDAEDRRPQQS